MLAALAVLGWPDDREASAHVEEDGHEVTPAGHYWSIVCDALAAADLAADLEREEHGTLGSNPGQRERVTRAIRTLHGIEKRRLQAGRDGDGQLASDLANLHLHEIAELSAADLRALVTRLVVVTLNPADMPRCEHCTRLTLDCGEVEP